MATVVATSARCRTAFLEDVVEGPCLGERRSDHRFRRLASPPIEIVAKVIHNADHHEQPYGIDPRWTASKKPHEDDNITIAPS